MTITDMKVDMFGVASTICHEFSHALEQHYCDSGGMPLLNDEIMIETGHSLESFLFGGLYSRHNRKGELKPSLQRWPSPAIYEHYKKYNHPIETRPSMDLALRDAFLSSLGRLQRSSNRASGTTRSRRLGAGRRCG